MSVPSADHPQASDFLDSSESGASERAVARTGEILDQVRRVFTEKGFEGASMQMLAQAAAMSAGNFYRYFPSKDAIIEALIERDLQTLEGEFEQVRHSANPRAAFRAIVIERVRSGECVEGPMLIEIESAALRRAAINHALCRVDRAIEKNLLELFARLTSISNEQANAQFRAQAQLIIILVKGVMRSRRLTESSDQNSSDQITETKAVQALSELVLDHVDSIIDQVVRLVASSTQQKQS